MSHSLSADIHDRTASWEPEQHFKSTLFLQICWFVWGCVWRATELCLRGTLKKKKWIKLFFGTRWHFGRTLTRSRASSCSSRLVFSFQFHWLHERGSRLQHVREKPWKTPEFTFKRTHKLSPDVPVLYLKVCEQIKGGAVGFLLTSQSCERAEIYEHQSEDKSFFLSGASCRYRVIQMLRCSYPRWGSRQMLSVNSGHRQTVGPPYHRAPRRSWERAGWLAPELQQAHPLHIRTRSDTLIFIRNKIVFFPCSCCWTQCIEITHQDLQHQSVWVRVIRRHGVFWDNTRSDEAQKTSRDSTMCGRRLYQTYYDSLWMKH